MHAMFLDCEPPIAGGREIWGFRRPRICELVRYFCEHITVKGAWEGPAALELFHHALAPVALLPIMEVISGVHIRSDLTLGLGTVGYDYLAQ